MSLEKPKPPTLEPVNERAGVHRMGVIFEIKDPEGWPDKMTPAVLDLDSFTVDEHGGSQLRRWDEHAWPLRHGGDQAEIDIEWDGDHKAKLVAIIQFQGRIDIDATGTIRCFDIKEFAAAVEPLALVALRAGSYNEYPTKSFVTADGLILADAGDKWQGVLLEIAYGKLPHGWPCDDKGQPLKGHYLEAEAA